MVARDDDDGVVPTRRRGDGRKQVRNRIVAVGDLAIVSVERSPADLRRHLLGLHRPGVADRPLARRSKLHIIGRRRIEVPMRVHVEEKEEEGLPRIAALQPVEAHLGQHHPLRVAGGDPLEARVGRQRRRIVVPHVEALAVAETAVRHGVRGDADRRVPGRAQRLGQRDGLPVVRQARQDAAVPVDGQRGEERHHGGHRPRAARNDRLEPNTPLLAHEAVDVRRRVARVAVAADVRRLEAVDENEKNIGVCERRVLLARRHRRREKRRAQQNRPCLHCPTSFFALSIQMRRCEPSSGTVTLKTPFVAVPSSRSPESASTAAPGVSHFGRRYESA